MLRQERERETVLESEICVHKKENFGPGLEKKRTIHKKRPRWRRELKKECTFEEVDWRKIVQWETRIRLRNELPLTERDHIGRGGVEKESTLKEED